MNATMEHETAESDLEGSNPSTGTEVHHARYENR